MAGLSDCLDGCVELVACAMFVIAARRLYKQHVWRSVRVRNTYRRETDMEELARHLGLRE